MDGQFPLAVYVNAGNDTNGNPRRGWILYGATTGQFDFVDEGYAGRGALRAAYPILARNPFFGDSGMLDIMPREYRRLRKLAASDDAKHVRAGMATAEWYDTGVTA